MPCIFCQIASKELPSAHYYEDDQLFAFLDNKPLFFGHTLLIPKKHIETYHDLPTHMIQHFFETGQLLSERIKKTMNAQGTFIAINNTVSQSVPHLHMHIVPRTKGDGLKGFFWPRHLYSTEEEMFLVAKKLQHIK